MKDFFKYHFMLSFHHLHPTLPAKMVGMCILDIQFGIERFVHKTFKVCSNNSNMANYMVVLRIFIFLLREF